jgi:hypothetical protein|tara:strand:- start:356 stop:616 length:261 start_codon:yes stop_codon:yes gene_type:complete
MEQEQGHEETVSTETSESARGPPIIPTAAATATAASFTRKICSLLTPTLKLIPTATESLSLQEAVEIEAEAQADGLYYLDLDPVGK